MTDNKIPAVYTGIAKVLAALKVEKNGTLPGNMGGKTYFTASDLSDEVKRQFVEAGLIIFPRERVTKHETMIVKERTMTLIGIEGEYKIVSTEDGSSETIAGVGDGSAIGTSVASNIASTNALKNALLRTFLVTEQSVEDQGKDGDEKASRAIEQATKKPAPAKPAPAPAKPAPAKPAAQTESPLKAKIRDQYVTPGLVTSDEANEQMRIAKAAGKTGDAVYQAMIDAFDMKLAQSTAAVTDEESPF